MGTSSSKSRSSSSYRSSGTGAAPSSYAASTGAPPGAPGGYGAPPPPPPGAPGGFAQFQSPTMRFRAIADSYTTLEQVQADLRRNGLESSNLIVAVDFTKSNEWTGARSFGGRSLHAIGDEPSPYEEAISVIGRTLSAFDDDGFIPCYGFGDATTGDHGVFSFLANDKPCKGLEQVLWRYRELCPYVRMAGPTSFAPAIRQAARIVEASGNSYHILLLVADGQVTRSSDLPPGQHSVQERETINAIVEASNLPLSIVMVGVGDGPWDLMKDFDDALPERKFDNFQFVNFTELLATTARDRQRREALFALRALMEIPEQYKSIQRLDLMGHVSGRSSRRSSLAAPQDPPVPPELLHGSAGSATAARPGPLPATAAPASARVSGAGGAAAAAAATPSASTSGASLAAAAGPAGPAAAGQRGPATPDPLYVCPITQDIMRDPVIAPDGYTYERAAITDWLARKSTSPLTNKAMGGNALIPNHGLRSAIMEWKQRNGMA